MAKEFMPSERAINLANGVWRACRGRGIPRVEVELVLAEMLAQSVFGTPEAITWLVENTVLDNPSYFVEVENG